MAIAANEDMERPAKVAKFEEVFNVPRGEMMTYFAAMLGDTDRNVKYFQAIGAAIEAFREKNGRRPIVLDIGTGSGLLSLFALLGGCEKVYAVDLNPFQVLRAYETLHLCAPDGAGTKWCVVAVDEKLEKVAQARSTLLETLPKGEGVQWKAAQMSQFQAEVLDGGHADMIVSELLATLVCGEDMFNILTIYEAMLNPAVEGGPYVVPRAATQSFAVVQFCTSELGELASSELRRVVRESYSDGMYVPSNGLSMHPAMYTTSVVVERVDFYSEHYDGPFRQSDPKHATVVEVKQFVEEGTLTVGVLEWRAHMWGDIYIENTLDGFREMSLRNAISRENHWGFMFVHVEPGDHLELYGCHRKRSPLQVTLVNKTTGHRVRSTTMDIAADPAAGFHSIAPLLDLDVAGPVCERLRALPPKSDVVIFERRSVWKQAVEDACQRHGLPEPFADERIGQAWLIRGEEAEGEEAEGEETDDEGVEAKGDAAGADNETVDAQLVLFPTLLADLVTETVWKQNGEESDETSVDLALKFAKEYLPPDADEKTLRARCVPCPLDVELGDSQMASVKVAPTSFYASVAPIERALASTDFSRDVAVAALRHATLGQLRAVMADDTGFRLSMLSRRGMVIPAEPDDDSEAEHEVPGIYLQEIVCMALLAPDSSDGVPMEVSPPFCVGGVDAGLASCSRRLLEDLGAGEPVALRDIPPANMAAVRNIVARACSQGFAFRLP
ncbi:hypothetical protein AB1Y20_015857 [Prymnesium parvum]|uniref:Uncharacterized protein n=1 Tax=Prymnesium parvum TaxID=97485 RepID=A0AB34JYA9_PRYPA